MKAKAFSRRVISYGPGGFHCPCSGPAPGARRDERQQKRRVLNRVLDKIERQERSVEHIDVGTVNDWCFDWDWYYDAWPGELSLHEEWEEYRKQNK
ncbi:hypothetical protein, partial [Enterococcus faecalis]|uniref:hypothetical protein n=1 Tax=Enterococcus faecalis TaxID=1351 RepID=UPI0025B26092